MYATQLNLIIHAEVKVTAKILGVNASIAALFKDFLCTNSRNGTLTNQIKKPNLGKEVNKNNDMKRIVSNSSL